MKTSSEKTAVCAKCGGRGYLERNVARSHNKKHVKCIKCRGTGISNTGYLTK